MKIKRFRAPDMRTALEQVRAEMGRDAVILQSRAVRGRGLWGWLGRGRRWVEVTAAWDGDGPGGRGQVGGGPAGVATRGVVDPGPDIPAGRSVAIPAPPEPPRNAALSGPRAGFGLQLPGNGAVARLDVAVGDGPLPPPLGRPPARPPVVPEPGPVPVSKPEPVPVHDATPVAAPEPDPAPELGPAVTRRVVLPPPASPLEGKVAVVGPTGAGKTATVAKLAARAVLDEGREVALLAADTYRLGATTALAAYAELLGLPLAVAYAPAEAAAWAEGLGAATCADLAAASGAAPLALVDTAGRNLLLPEVAADLAALLEAVRPARVLLVLPATLAPVEATALVAVGRRLGVTDLVLTKLDECLDPAAVLARAARWGLPLALVGCGQRVPDDLLPGTAGALEPWLARDRRQDAGGGASHGRDAAGVG